MVALSFSGNLFNHPYYYYLFPILPAPLSKSALFEITDRSKKKLFSRNRNPLKLKENILYPETNSNLAQEAAP